MAKMAIELKDAADRYRLLEKEKAKETKLEKAMVAAKEARSKIRASKEELRQAGDIAAGKPFLLQRFLGVVPHIDTMKRSACIEGARMALARVKTYWADMQATAIAIQDPAVGQVSVEHYFEEVQEVLV